VSIYVEKRNGRPTGLWKVEVTINGQRHVARTNSMEEAKRIEQELKLTGHKPDSSRVQKYTLGHLDDDACRRLWDGQKDGEYAYKRWRRCLAILGPQTPITEVRVALLERLAHRLREQGLSNKTINRHLACVSKALRWAWRNDILLSMPYIPRLHEDEGRIAYLRNKEIPKFLDYLYGHERPSTALCLEVLLVTGMRAGELMSLRPHNVELEDDDALIVLEDKKVKTGEGRTIPIPRELGERLAKLVADKLPDYDLLLRACHRATESLGTKDKVTPHVLRHTAATILTASGTPTLVVADLLGHRNLETTRKYAHPTRDALREATRSMMLRGNAGGNLRETSGETKVKSGEPASSLLLQSAPFAARDIPPLGDEALEKPKASVKRPKSNKKRTQGS
jgi:integrase